MKNTKWSASNTDNGKNLGIIEFQDDHGNWQNFHIITARNNRIAFGRVYNVGFFESGYIIKEDDETNDDVLIELLADLQAYYNDGPRYVSRIICNERM